MRKLLTSNEKKIIRDNYLDMTSQQIGDHLGRSKHSVKSFLYRNGLHLPKEVAKKRRAKGMVKPFTPEEDQFIRVHIHDWSIKKIGKELHRTSLYVSSRAKELGFSDVIEKKALESRIKPGTEPPNKGKKLNEFMSPDAVRKFRKNQYKKGHKPHNTKYDGAIETRWHSREKRNYCWIRISEGRWIQYHRFVWEEYNGPIPDGFCIVFIDGNSENCSIDNLEMISKEENMLRNSIHDIPKEVIPTMAAISKIKKKIKEYEEHT